MSEEDRLVVIRFGRDWDKDCMRQDEVLYRIADRVKNFAVVYVCDLDQVPDFNQMYELYDPMTIMFFFRNKHMMCDFGTGNNNKLNWVLEDKQELIDIIETIYRGAKKGRGLVTRDESRMAFGFSANDCEALTLHKHTISGQHLWIITHNSLDGLAKSVSTITWTPTNKVCKGQGQENRNCFPATHGKNLVAWHHHQVVFENAR
ncbi:mitosis protein dim1 [Aureobasidium sp. EXF-12344]|nr:mitosis protein dim1 [Aureobasidium sp. EXF-12344]